MIKLFDQMHTYNSFNRMKITIPSLKSMVSVVVQCDEVTRVENLNLFALKLKIVKVRCHKVP